MIENAPQYYVTHTLSVFLLLWWCYQKCVEQSKRKFCFIARPIFRANV